MSLLNTVSISKASIPGYELTDEEKQIEVGKWIRDFAINFTNAANNVKYGDITGAKENKYYLDESYTSNRKQLIMYSMSEQRMTAYRYFLNGNTQMAYKFYKIRRAEEHQWYITSNHKLAFDCSSFISFLYKYTANINLCNEKAPGTSMMMGHYDKSHNKNNCSCGCIYVGKLKGISVSALRAGDIILRDGHVMMFNRAGDEKDIRVIDCSPSPVVGISTAREHNKENLVKKNAIIIPVVSIVISIISFPVVIYLIKHSGFANYANRIQISLWGYIPTLILYGMMFLDDKFVSYVKEKGHYIFYKGFFFLIALLPITISINVAYRLMLFFDLPKYILYSDLYLYYREKNIVKNKKVFDIIIFVALVLWLIFRIYRMWSGASIMPYRNILFERI